jgi:hypothetical protein
MSMPLFGIEEEGIAIIDCPGTHENNALRCFFFCFFWFLVLVLVWFGFGFSCYCFVTLVSNS